MVKFVKRNNVSVLRVAGKIVGTVLGLYVAGEIMSVIGTVMTGKCSAFFSGLTLIGWNVNTTTNCITAVSGSGILAVIGLLAIASIVLEFVQIKM